MLQALDDFYNDRKEVGALFFLYTQQMQSLKRNISIPIIIGISFLCIYLSR